MIISHSRKFIFVKTIKTAGTSLEMALSKYCAPDDVLTPLTPHEEAERLRIAGTGARNYMKPAAAMRPAERARWLLRGRRSQLFVEHPAAAHARRQLGAAVWDGYFKFAVTRHPYERCVSRYFYEVKHAKNPAWDPASFDQFLRYETAMVCGNWRMLTERDRLLVDFVARYETLEADLAVVSDRIGLDHNLYEDMKLIRAKEGIRPKDGSVRQTLSETQRTLIALLCETEMTTFGYGADGTVQSSGEV